MMIQPAERSAGLSQLQQLIDSGSTAVVDVVPGDNTTVVVFPPGEMQRIIAGLRNHTIVNL